MLSLTCDDYLRQLPDSIPDDLVLVHNHVRPTRQLRMRGFRAWLQAPSERLAPCSCGWATELGQHYRVAKSGMVTGQ